MTEFQKFGLYLAYVLLVFAPIWCSMMLHDDLTRINSKLEKIIRRVEKNDQA